MSRTEGLDGIDGLALSMIVALVVSTDRRLAGGRGLHRPGGAAPAAGIGVARLPRTIYSLMVAVLPAVATVVGVVVLAQIPSAAEVVGVALVVVAVAVHREPVKAESPAPSAPDPAPA